MAKFGKTALQVVALFVAAAGITWGLYVGYFWLFGDHGPFSTPGITAGIRR